MNNGRLTHKQKIAIYYLVVLEQDIDEVAERVDKSPEVVKRWLKNPIFREALDNKLEQIEKKAIAIRDRHNQMILDKVYGVIHQKIHNGDLEHMKLTMLMAFVRDMSAEHRADHGRGKGAVGGARDDDGGLQKLVERFADSQSAKVLKFDRPKKTKTAGGN